MTLSIANQAISSSTNRFEERPGPRSIIRVMFKTFIQKRLEKYVHAYFKKHPEVKLVVVTGSVGKTSTKRAVATVLAGKYRVAYHQGNHNTLLSAPLSILGIEYPESVHSPLAWLSVFAAARKRIKEPTGADVIIQELGTDHPGEIAQFGRYLKPDIAIVTGVTPEHMEFFGTIDEVAKEELGVAAFSNLVLINRDDIDSKYAELMTNPNINTYGTSGAAEYRFEIDDFSLENGYSGKLIMPEHTDRSFAASVRVIGEHSLRPVMASVAVGAKLGLSPDEIVHGVSQIRAVPGRMNLLDGLNDTFVIDDSYNSSPAAAAAALQTVYALQTPQRIVILGDMNELGDVSASEHTALGALCDAGLLSWVVTVGPQAEQYLAPAAKAQGCQVKSFRSAIDAGAFVRGVSEPGAVILVKGSQGGIYTEEATKILVRASEDVELVRQSPTWQKTKDAFFSKF